MTAYKRITRDVFVVQIYVRRGTNDRTTGWHDLHVDDTSAAAYASLLSYRVHFGPEHRLRIDKRQRVRSLT